MKKESSRRLIKITICSLIIFSIIEIKIFGLKDEKPFHLAT